MQIDRARFLLLTASLASGGCNDGDRYWMESREYNSVAMREGQAHFAELCT